MNMLRLLGLLLFLSTSISSSGQDSALIHNKVVKKDHNKDIKSVFGKVDIGNLKVINSEDLDYSASLVGDGVIFTSTRSHHQQKEEKKRKNWKKKLSTLFYAQLGEDGKLRRPSPLQGEVNDRHHEGSASFTKSGDKMYFNRNAAKKNKKGVVHLKIYSATKMEGMWTDVKELSLNGDNFSSCHPSISADGKRLYFASNRKGGFGGMDIYVSYFKRGQWGEPINLGPLINSSGNEVFPYIAEDGILYFSSDSQGGMGGLDIFRSKKLNDSDRSWKHKQNMGHPFNSKEDDFGFFVNKECSAGLFTSSRSGGKGRDDIYFWQLKEKPIFHAQNEVPEKPTVPALPLDADVIAIEDQHIEIGQY
ncbi:MAG: hypothetical protein AAF985_16850 [Bacteroidota bacterium]